MKCFKKSFSRMRQQDFTFRIAILFGRLLDNRWATLTVGRLLDDFTQMFTQLSDDTWTMFG